MKLKLFALAALFIIVQFPVWAQSEDGPSVRRRNDRETEQDPFLEKARLKAKIEVAEHESTKLKSDIVKLAELSSQLQDSLQNKSVLGEDNDKRLSNIEKLAKSIRDNQAGESGGDDLERAPQSLTEAITLLDGFARKLKDDGEKTNRFTTSAAVIDETNHIITIVHYIRKNFPRK